MAEPNFSYDREVSKAFRNFDKTITFSDDLKDKYGNMLSIFDKNDDGKIDAEELHDLWEKVVNGSGFDQKLSVKEADAIVMDSASGFGYVKNMFKTKATTAKELGDFLNVLKNTVMQSVPKTNEIQNDAYEQVKLANNVDGFKDDYDSFISKYAEEYDLDPNLVKAIIKKESNFNPNLYSSAAQCKGLMQVSSKYVKGNLYAPEKNIAEGCRIFRDSLNAFNGDVKKALMGYNRGVGGASKAFSRGKNPENDTYVKMVLNYYKELTQNNC